MYYVFFFCFFAEDSYRWFVPVCKTIPLPGRMNFRECTRSSTSLATRISPPNLWATVATTRSRMFRAIAFQHGRYPIVSYYCRIALFPTSVPRESLNPWPGKRIVLYCRDSRRPSKDLARFFFAPVFRTTKRPPRSVRAHNALGYTAVIIHANTTAHIITHPVEYTGRSFFPSPFFPLFFFFSYEIDIQSF